MIVFQYVTESFETFFHKEYVKYCSTAKLNSAKLSNFFPFKNKVFSKGTGTSVYIGFGHGIAYFGIDALPNNSKNWSLPPRCFEFDECEIIVFQCFAFVSVFLLFRND